MFEEIRNIKTQKKDLRSFGVTIGTILLVIGGFLFFKENEYYQIFIYISGAFIGFGLLAPIILKPIYMAWMFFAVILGWIMTRIILSVLFYLVITPIGLISRLFGKNFLELKKSNQDSYWNHRIRDLELNQDFEKQF